MKNFKIIDKEDNQEYWVSRSIAVTGFIFTKDKDNDLCVLANKRGSGTPDFQGYWNCPCGYLDYDETILEAITREISEETGYLCPDDIALYDIDSDPKSNKQNVTIMYYGYVSVPQKEERVGGEENEVDEIKWIKLSDISKYKWAFGHDQIIRKIESSFLY